MSVTSGFFNSLNGDRKYNAEQMSSIFDGVINDGVFANIGTAFEVKANYGNFVNIGIGKAWFNSAWLLNDSILLLDLGVAEVLQNRYDAIVIEIDHSDTVRSGSIKVVKGTPSTEPLWPELTNTEYVHQYPLAYVYRKAESSEVTQADIANCIGTDKCPYITGILQVQSIEKNVAQWQAQWEEWYANHTSTAGDEVAKMLSDLQIMLDDASADIESWKTTQEADFQTWFDSIKGLLDEDPAASLASAVATLQTDVSKKVSKTGDTMTGNLELKQCENGSGYITKNHTESLDYGTRVVDIDANGNKLQLVLQASGKKASLVIDGELYELFGTHNYKQAYDYSSEDLTAGASGLETGRLYFVYE